MKISYLPPFFFHSPLVKQETDERTPPLSSSLRHIRRSCCTASCPSQTQRSEMFAAAQSHSTPLPHEIVTQNQRERNSPLFISAWVRIHRFGIQELRFSPALIAELGLRSRWFENLRKKLDQRRRRRMV